eukprot:SAG11_NODE_1098_length_5875_cov_3.667936_3_plen_84_part_00
MTRIRGPIDSRTRVLYVELKRVAWRCALVGCPRIQVHADQMYSMLLLLFFVLRLLVLNSGFGIMSRIEQLWVFLYAHHIFATA